MTDITNKLWNLLDDIDTLDDACKSDDASFRKACYKIQQKRWALYNPEPQHNTESNECWCEPAIEENGNVIIHNRPN